MQPAAPARLIVNSSSQPASAARRPRSSSGGSATFTWGVTCLLLALASAIFALGGTGGEPGGLYGRIAAVGFLVIALMIFFIRHHRSSRR
jgi:hypothetical protein